MWVLKKSIIAISVLMFCVLAFYPLVLDAQEDSPSFVCKVWDYAWSGKFDKLKKCIAEGKDINETNVMGQSGVFLSAQFGSFEIVKYLVEHGADVNLKDKCDRTPLMMACCIENLRPEVRAKRPYTQIAKYLIDHGANVNARTRCSPYANESDRTIWTSLRCVKGNGSSSAWYKPDPKLIKYLKSKGARD